MWRKVWFTCEWKCDSHVKVSATRIWKIAPNSAVCVYSEIDQLHHMANHHACSPFGASKSYNIRSTLMLGVCNSRSLIVILGLKVFTPASSSLSKSVTRMWRKVWFTCEWKCDSHVKVSATRIWKIAPNSAVCVYSEIDQLHHMANHHACSPFGASKSYNIRSTLMFGVSNSRSLIVVLGLKVFIPPFGCHLWSYSNHIL